MLFKVESRSEADRFDSAPTLVHTLSLQLANQIVTHLNCLAVEGQVCSLAAQVLNVGWVLGSKRGQFLCQVGAGGQCELTQFVVFDHLVLFRSQNLTDWITHVSVAMTEGSHHPGIFVVVEATREHLLSERHEIGRGCKIPQLVSPESTSLAHTCLHFVYDKVDAVLFGNVLKALSEFV